MSMTYTWQLTGLKKQNGAGVTDAVVQTYWKCSGTDEEGNEGTFNGATPFDLNTINPDQFTPYEELTEAMVLGWIEDVVNGSPSYKAHIDEQIMKQIEAATMPVTEVNEGSFPWSPPSDTPVVEETVSE